MNTLSESNSSAEGIISVEGGKFLSFFLGEEEYAIEILKVQEIIGVTAITPVPKMPAFIDGIINLRDKIVPVINLRKRFKLPPADHTEDTVMIVLRQGEELRAILVDRVSEVADIKKEQIEQIETACSNIETKFLLGLGNIEGVIKLILNVEVVAFGFEI